MGSRTMLSSNGGRSSQFQQLARQNSLYNLTLEEVQNQLQDVGKPLSSMNMDELLRNIWTAEDSQAFSAAIDNNNNNNGNVVLNENSDRNAANSGSNGLQRQGSLTLPRTLSRKTVDEVWRDIQQGQQMKGGEKKKQQHRQPTLGEMTLEDFLVKAGVVREDNNCNANNNTNNNNNNGNSNSNSTMSNSTLVMSPNMAESSQGAMPVCAMPPTMDVAMAQNFQPAEWMQYQFNPAVAAQQQQQQQQSMMAAYNSKRGMRQNLPLTIPGNSLMEGGYGDNQLALSSPMMGGTSSDSQTPGRKRGTPESIMERTVERRQKRMIKNRESAARSRARKQAYQQELENEVQQLKEENARLKMQEKFMAEMPPPLSLLDPTDPLRRLKDPLKRLHSAPF
ncbi:hypothetical protein SUGI_1098240 [Cryptomeria japonica]|uniref:ABSCISIC ACID-INSENSITIVE 5-like protein 4 n=1 Tax=Cryptomeria japonica TaxID=3369 RepID=UPI0024147D79|nr:ABSCISIC ACID-INSENSITIVE 5-like protein 4 [Cryptomeria japonica]GLJ51679.1 hypothetical protein SUGI_1098240 [Cryptomeria japonica]